jgi:arylsulfatase A-like enzyme
MLRNPRLVCSLAILIASLSGVGTKAAPASSDGAHDSPHPRPNIVLIMSDDHAYQALGAYGSVVNETPNIDRIAAEGMRFDRAFVTDSLCAPSRAVILTGKHSHINGVRNNETPFDSSQPTFPAMLRKAGYETAVFGKWGLSAEPTGFDDYGVLGGQGGYYQPEVHSPDGQSVKQGYVTDVITDMSLAWLRKVRDDGSPFMLMVWHSAPHREWLPGPDHLGDFMSAPLPVPSTFFDDYAGRSAAAAAEMRIADNMGLTNDNKIDPAIVKALGLPGFLPWYDEAYANNLGRLTEAQRQQWDKVYGPINAEFLKSPPSGEALTRWKYQRFMQDYLATLQSVDDSVGRILDYLDKAGLAENTVVIYLSDQGFFLGEHGWFDKRFMYEQSLRTPLLVRWPGVIEPDSVDTHLVQNLDLAPTLLSMAGAHVPGDMQGASLIPILEGKAPAWRDAIYYHYYEYPGIHAVKRHYGIRTQRYKLIHFYYDIDEWELYDLDADPDELHNVYDDDRYAAVRSELHEELQAVRRQYGDSDKLTKQFLDADLAAAQSH